MSTPSGCPSAMRVVCVQLPQKSNRSSGREHIRRALSLIGIIGVLVMTGAPEAGSAAEVEVGRRKAEVCASCHGADGNSTSPAIPSLAGQPPLYTYYQLLMFKQRQREDPQMSPFAADLSEADMQDLAAYYATQTPVASGATGDPAKLEPGQKLVKAHYCDSCHAPGLVGQNHIPRLAGQHYEYLVKQLRAFKAQTRTDLDGSMTMAAQPLSAEDIELLAHYIAHMRPMP
jgi:cytochrome c553